MELNTNNIIKAALESDEMKQKINKAVEDQLERTIRTALDNAIGYSSEFQKNMTKSLKAVLPINIFDNRATELVSKCITRCFEERASEVIAQKMNFFLNSEDDGKEHFISEFISELIHEIVTDEEKIMLTIKHKDDWLYIELTKIDPPLRNKKWCIRFYQNKLTFFPRNFFSTAMEDYRKEFSLEKQVWCYIINETEFVDDVIDWGETYEHKDDYERSDIDDFLNNFKK